MLAVVALLGVVLLWAVPSFATPHGGFSSHTFKCEQCHNTHMAQGSKILSQPTEKQLCYACHDGTGSIYDERDAFGEATVGTSTAVSHHPVPEGSLKCSGCHTPHHGTDDGYIRSLAAGASRETSGSAVCGACHGPGSTNVGGDVMSGYVGTAHDTRMPDPPSGTKIKCVACHAPHGSTNLSLITTSVVDPLGVTRSIDTSRGTSVLCLACHAVATGTFPGEQTASLGRHASQASSTKALTTFPGAQAPAGSCANCHDPHGKGGYPKYTRAEGNDLCRTCHDAGGVVYPADYSYQGGTAYAKSPHNTSSGAVFNVLHSDSDGFAAWESTAMPTPSSPGTRMATSTANALLGADGDFARTALADQTGQSDYQLYRFQLPNGGAGLQSLRTTWIGYGSAVAGYPVTTYLWDNQAGSWVEYAQAMAPASSTFTTSTTSPSRFVDGSGRVWVLAQAKKAVDADIVTTPTVTASADGSVTVSWRTLGLSNGYVDYGLSAPSYVSSAGADTLDTTHAVTFSPPAAVDIFHFSVRGTDASGLSRSTSDATFGWPPASPTPAGPFYNTGNHDTVVPVSLNWTMSDAERAPYTYQVRVTGANGYSSTSSWLTSPTVSLSLSYSDYQFQVLAKDKNGQLSAWSAPSPFSVIYQYYPGGSCPFLFTWDGLGYRFEADNFTAGRIGGTVSTGYQQPNPNDAYVVSNPPMSKDGQLEFRLVEERYEVDYLDSYRLFAADSPTGAKVFAEKAVAGKRTFPPLQSALHTTRNLHAPLSVVTTDTGQDVLADVAADDGRLLELNESRETTFTYKTIELDLGADAATAPQAKIVMDAVTEFPITPAGIAHRAQFGLPQKLEVQNTDGTWRSIAASANPLPTPPEFSRPYVFDLTNAIRGTTGKVRFTFLFRTLIDYIGIDTTQDEWVTLTEVPSAGATLAYHGVDEETGTANTAKYVYGSNVASGNLYPGSYTRYGDVTPLVGPVDDKFVIMGQGDEITLRYQPLPDPAEGLTRQYVFSAYGYYKDRKTDLPATVDPLPFQAMSNYPYPASESYPTDADHQAYLADYNTRIVEAPGQGSVAFNQDAAAAVHRSVNADTVMLDAGFASGGSGGCGQCHAVHGAADTSGALYPSLTFAPESSTCLGNGTLTCHSTAEASADNVNIAASITATSNPSAHHDITPAQQSASGSKLKCTDCHDPHKETAANPFSDPRAIGSTVTPDPSKWFDASGTLYIVVGAEHDGVVPSATALSVTATDPAAPRIGWTTNEPATTWLDWGLTTAYERGSIGTSLPLTTAHSVTASATMGSTYHYRIRSADAVGNEFVSADATYVAVAAPSAPASVTPNAWGTTVYGPTTVFVPVSWDPATPSDADPLEYQVFLDGAGQGWQTTTNKTLVVPTVDVMGVTNHSWSVLARDSVHTYAVSTPSPSGTISVNDLTDYSMYFGSLGGFGALGDLAANVTGRPLSALADVLWPGPAKGAAAAAAGASRAGEEFVASLADGEAVAGSALVVAAPGAHYSANSDLLVLQSIGLDRAPATFTVSAAWESSGTSSPPLPVGVGTPVDGARLASLQASDGTYLTTGIATGDREWNWQVARFSLSEAERNRLSELRVLWQGYGEPTTGYGTTVRIWNPTTLAWVTVASKTALAAPGTAVAFSKSAVPGSVCLGCHGGTLPAGVTMPSGVTTIGPSWTTTTQASPHAGLVGFSGWGGGLIGDYTRGQAPNVSCATCHDPHGSSNLYHIPSTVKGRTGITVTNGNSVQQLCAACHTGTVVDYHKGCYDCHYIYADTSGYGHYMRGYGPTAADDCLSCHGHGKTWQHHADPNCTTECHGPAGDADLGVWTSF